MLFDDFGRPVKSMRIQVNTTCNFKCFFCHMEGTEVNSSEMKPTEIERVVQIAAKWGVNKIKFTGGEPLLRRDIAEIVARVRKHISGDISLTTNGVLLVNKAVDLKKAGLNRVNISMHSIDQEGFQFITGTDALDKVKDGIRAAREAGLGPIKINFVVLKDVNVDQIDRMIDFATENNAMLQLIEYETTKEAENSEDYQRYHYSLEPIERKVSMQSLEIERNELHNRERYTILNKGKKVSIEFVKPMHNTDFCNSCTRMRLTSTGQLKPCLMRSDNLTDVLHEIRGGNREIMLDSIFKNAVKKREPYWRESDVIESEILRKI
ncbi:MAG: cyclic pyranopterin phosphate synthase [Thermoplasmatales archaeon B_DKE]|nr:MAG: cyclic pyranopterin phosphate synthase [Thermoplasmatales archaeon B_DKE]